MHIIQIQVQDQDQIRRRNQVTGRTTLSMIPHNMRRRRLLLWLAARPEVFCSNNSSNNNISNNISNNKVVAVLS